MLEISNVCLSLSGVRVLERVSFELVSGDCLALMGPNGSGKSSLLRILAGLIRADSGQIRAAGESLDDAKRRQQWRRRVGFVGEVPGLYETLSGRENLGYFGALQGLGPARLGQRMDDVIETLGLAGCVDQPVAQLSKGFKLRLALARALLHDPDVLLLDEPSNGLDPSAQQQWIELLLAERSRGRLIVLASHDVQEVDRLASKVARLGPEMRWLRPQWRLRCAFGADGPPDAFLRRIAGEPSWRTVGAEVHLFYSDPTHAATIIRDITSDPPPMNGWEFARDWWSAYEAE